MPACRRSFRTALLGAVLCIAPFHPAAAQPRRIMSLNICTDQLLLALAPASRIASVTFMAREQQPLKLWPQAARIPINYGSAEEVLALHPDLVLAGPFLPPLTKTLLAKSGARIVTVPLAQDFDQIRDVTRLVAKAVGAEARGEALINRIDAAVTAAHRSGPPVSALVWQEGGLVPGPETLVAELLGNSGFVSQSATRRLGQGAYLPLEEVLAERRVRRRVVGRTGGAGGRAGASGSEDKDREQLHRRER